MQKLFGDQKIIEELLKKEEKRIENEENKPTEKESIKTDEKSDDPVESQDEKSLEKSAEKPDAEKPDAEKPDAEEEESSEPIEENITSKTVDDDSSIRQRKPKSDEASNDIELPVVETIGQTERQTNKDDNDAEQTVDLENKKTE